MSDYQKWKDRYDNGYATENHIYRLVVLGRLTEQQYTQIVGKEFAS